jgi:hypothetical protein
MRRNGECPWFWKARRLLRRKMKIENLTTGAVCWRIVLCGCDFH